ncbi:MAG: hypothetical protein [Bacteriophage sp.]|nr:MAG: hypothetical protein [Bacteriophage sp.]
MRSVYALLKKSEVDEPDWHNNAVGIRFDCMLRIMSTKVEGELGGVVNFTKEQTEAISRKCGRNLRFDDYLPIYKIIEMGFTPSQVVWALLNSGISPTFALEVMDRGAYYLLDMYDRRRATAWAEHLSAISKHEISRIINNKIPLVYCNIISKNLYGKRKKLLKYPKEKAPAKRLCEDAMIRQLLAVYWYIKYRDYGDKYRNNFIQAAAFTIIFSPVINAAQDTHVKAENPNGLIIISSLHDGLRAVDKQREEQEQYLADIKPPLSEQ